MNVNLDVTMSYILVEYDFEYLEYDLLVLEDHFRIPKKRRKQKYENFLLNSNSFIKIIPHFLESLES